MLQYIVQIFTGGVQTVMNRQCQFTDACPMFEYFQRSARTVYMNMYCLNFCTDCCRRQRRLAGKPVPDDLLPTGERLGIIEDDDAN